MKATINRFRGMGPGDDPRHWRRVKVSGSVVPCSSRLSSWSKRTSPVADDDGLAAR
jgi:hypothetical protein